MKVEAIDGSGAVVEQLELPLPDIRSDIETDPEVLYLFLSSDHLAVSERERVKIGKHDGNEQSWGRRRNFP